MSDNVSLIQPAVPSYVLARIAFDSVPRWFAPAVAENSGEPDRMPIAEIIKLELGNQTLVPI